MTSAVCVIRFRLCVKVKKIRGQLFQPLGPFLYRVCQRKLRVEGGLPGTHLELYSHSDHLLTHLT